MFVRTDPFSNAAHCLRAFQAAIAAVRRRDQREKLCEAWSRDRHMLPNEGATVCYCSGRNKLCREKPRSSSHEKMETGDDLSW